MDSRRSCWFPAQILSGAVRIQSKTAKILEGLARKRKMATGWKQALLHVRSLLPTKVTVSPALSGNSLSSQCGLCVPEFSVTNLLAAVRGQSVCNWFLLASLAWAGSSKAREFSGKGRNWNGNFSGSLPCHSLDLVLWRGGSPNLGNYDLADVSVPLQLSGFRK